jgi:LemA protein
MEGWIFLGAIVALIVWLIMIYNGLVARKNEYKNAFAQIDVQLKRRHELIPNLVNTAKGYLAHEQETLERVTSARNAAAQVLAKAASSLNPSDIASLGTAEQALTSALGGLNIAVEAYPELKADSTMLQLVEELSSTENRVAGARQYYNDAVMTFNTYRQSFPNNLVATNTGFKQDAALLEFDDKAEIQKAPEVSF